MKTSECVRAKTVVVAGEGSSFPGAVGGRGRAGVWEREEEQPKESERNAHVMLGRYARKPEYGELHLCCYASAIQIFLLLVRENP